MYWNVVSFWKSACKFGIEWWPQLLRFLMLNLNGAFFFFRLKFQVTWEKSKRNLHFSHLTVVRYKVEKLNEWGNNSYPCLFLSGYFVDLANARRFSYGIFCWCIWIHYSMYSLRKHRNDKALYLDKMQK